MGFIYSFSPPKSHQLMTVMMMTMVLSCDRMATVTLFIRLCFESSSWDPWIACLCHVRAKSTRQSPSKKEQELSSERKNSRW